MMHMMRNVISLHSLRFDGASLLQDGDTVSSHLRQGPTPHPSRARVTATAKIIQRGVCRRSFRFAGFPLEHPARAIARDTNFLSDALYKVRATDRDLSPRKSFRARKQEMHAPSFQTEVGSRMERGRRR